MERLEDEAHLLGPHAGALVLAERGEVVAVEDHAAAGRPVEAGEEAEQRGLAAARGPGDGQEAAGLEIERDISQDGDLAPAREVGPGERLAAQDGHEEPAAPSTHHIGKRRAPRRARSLRPRPRGVPRRRPRRRRPPSPSAEPDRGRGRADRRSAGHPLRRDEPDRRPRPRPEEAYPALVQQKIDAAGLRYRVVNAGVSGETSAGARRRMDWLLRQPVAVLVIETGANDGLRGQDPDATRANIQAIFDEARRQQPAPRLVLAAMEALPNYGEDYRPALPRDLPRAGEGERRDARAVPARGRGGRGTPQPARRHPPHRRRPRAGGRERLEGPPAAALACPCALERVFVPWGQGATRGSP